MDEDRERLWSCTTSNFEGVVSMITPGESWVARWQVVHASQPESSGVFDRCEQGITEFVPGCYAIAANGDSYAYRCKGLICGHR